jgi:hypothetical protein
MAELKMKFSIELRRIFEELEDDGDYVAYELGWLHDSSELENILDITYMSVSKDYARFDVIIGGKRSSIKIHDFVNEYFPGIFPVQEVNAFVRKFNDKKYGGVAKIKTTPIPVEPFKYNPTNVRSTFLSLVTKTYPHGHEKELLQFLPKLDKDRFGNYYKIIPGDDTTMFTSHLDTADRKQLVTKLLSSVDSDGDEHIITDGNSILGADDKAGVAVMLYMMHNKVPGLYYFFLGEEVGGIGSNLLSGDYTKTSYLENIKRCVSFDRRKTVSVITRQVGRQCCSDEFANALCDEYDKSGLDLSPDAGGIYTDSASFIDDIPECTNISVGYNFEHTAKETQNISYLDRLAKASVNVDWSSLPTNRKIGMSSELIKKYKVVIDEIKKVVYELEVKMVGTDDRIYIRLDLDNAEIGTIAETLTQVQMILNKNKIYPAVIFDETYIKIELR